MIKEIETKEELLTLLEKNNNYYYSYDAHGHRDGSWSYEFVGDRELSHSLLYSFEHGDWRKKFFNIDGYLVYQFDAPGYNPAIMEPLAEKYFRKYLETGERRYVFSSPNWS